MLDLYLIQECAPSIHPATVATLVQVESSADPYAIGVVGMTLTSQPTKLSEAVSVSESLLEQGYNISLGLGQINIHNFDGLGLDLNSVFDPCTNLKAAEEVLNSCYSRAQQEFSNAQEALKASLSCYYSNNFTRGFEPDDDNGNSYIDRFLINRRLIPSDFYASVSDSYRIPDLSIDSIDEGGVQTQTEKRREQQAVEDLTPNEKHPWDVFSELT